MPRKRWQEDLKRTDLEQLDGIIEREDCDLMTRSAC